LFPLVGYISLDTFIVEADRGNKVSHAPYAAVEIDVPHEFESLLDPDARFDLECLHGGSNGEVRWNLDLQVYVIFGVLSVCM
jgi:hypothetical protein